MESNQKIPTANKFLQFNEKKNKKFKVLTVLLLIVLLISIGINILIYTFNIEVITENVIVNNNILDNTISKEEAESKNLSNINKNPKDFSDQVKFYTSSIVNEQGDYPLRKTLYASSLSLEMDKDGNIFKLNKPILPSYSDILFINSENRKSISIDNKRIAKNIADYIKWNKLPDLEIDVSFTYLPNYIEILENLEKEMVEYSYYLTIYLYPKWGDEINYNNFAPITNDFHKSDLITQASKLVDYIKVMSYDYTGVLDILPGSITPTNWYEKVIQYYISKVQDRNKIIMGINTESYQWPEREVAINPILNYSFLKKEAEIIPRDFFKEFIRQNSMKKESEFNIDEDVFKFTKENKSFIAIMPSDEQIANQVKIAGEYGVYGIFYK